MISFACSGCGKEFTVGDEYRGRKTKCPNCKSDILVPGPKVGPPPAEDRVTALGTSSSAQADLVLERIPSATGSVYGMEVQVDGQLSGTLAERDRLVIKVSPGSHSLRFAGGGIRRTHTINVSVDQPANYEIYFSNWGIIGGGIKLKRVTDPKRIAIPDSIKSQKLGVNEQTSTGSIGRAYIIPAKSKPNDARRAWVSIVLGILLAALLTLKFLPSGTFSFFYGETVDSAQDAYKAGYVWGARIRSDGVDATRKRFVGTIHDPDNPVYAANRSYFAAYHQGLFDGQEGSPRVFYEKYGNPGWRPRVGD